MRLRFFGIALGFLLVPAVVSADGHRAGVFAGGSYMDASKLFGNHTSGEIVLGKEGWRKNVAIIGDFSVHGGSHDGDEIGPRSGFAGLGLRWAKNDTSPVVFGGHVLGGGVSGPGGNQTLGLGGLFEYLPYRDEPDWHPGFRFQYDYLIREGPGNLHRISVGVVFRYQPR